MTKQQMQQQIEKLGYDNIAPGIGVRSNRNGLELWLDDKTNSPEIRENLKGLGWNVSDNPAHPLTWTEQ